LFGQFLLHTFFVKKSTKTESNKIGFSDCLETYVEMIYTLCLASVLLCPAQMYSKRHFIFLTFCLFS